MGTATVHFERINARNVLATCDLNHTLTDQQRKMVADNAVSIALARCSENAWVRAIYTGEVLIGLIMLHIGSDYADGIDCPGVFLWRLMIAGPYQGKGYGLAAMEFLFKHLKALGIPEITTSYGLGEGSPEGFYRRLGFVPTGDHYGEEIEVVLRFEA